MTKPLTDAVAQALKAGAPLALLLNIEHPQGMGYLWTGVGNLPQFVPGLSGDYYRSLSGGLFSNFVATYIDPKIDFLDPALLEKRVGQTDLYAIRWTGFVKADFSETYTFYLNSDDGSRVYVNNVLVLDVFVDKPISEFSGTIALTAGWYPIILEFYENAGGAGMQMSYSSASTPKQVIPTDHLRSQVNYVGMGKFGTVSPIAQVTDLQIQEVAITVIGLQPDAAILLAENIRNKKATVSLVAFDERGQVIPDPYLLVDALIDYQEFNVDESGEATIVYHCKSGFYSLEYAINEVWSAADQKSKFPTDVGLDLMHLIAEKQTKWTLT